LLRRRQRRFLPGEGQISVQQMNLHGFRGAAVKSLFHAAHLAHSGKKDQQVAGFRGQRSQHGIGNAEFQRPAVDGPGVAGFDRE